MPQQLDVFGDTIAPSSNSSAGTRVKLSRADACCDNIVTLGSSKPIHAASMHCATCGTFRGWLSTEAADFITATRAKFGAPETVVLRTRSFAARPSWSRLVSNQRRANHGRARS
jgi:hypothetical protein